MATTESAVQTESTERTRAGVTYSPRVDIWETTEGLYLRADLPGVAEDALDIRLDDRVLTIEGDVAIQEYSNLQPIYTEYRIGNFSRRFVLSDDIDTEAIQARLANGVLDLTLPKAERARPRRIAISAN